MVSYLARVASVDGVDDALVMVAPLAVRSRWVDEETGAALGAALGGVAAVVFGIVVNEATLVVVAGAADVAAGCGFVTVGGEDPSAALRAGFAGPAGETPAFRRGGAAAATTRAGAEDVVMAGCVVVTPGGFVAVTAGTGAVLVTVGVPVTTAAGAGGMA
jgi:hypothetical protein